MKRKIIFFVLAAALLPAACVFGMLKTFKGMAEKGKTAYPAAKLALDKNPTIAATIKHGNSLEYPAKATQDPNHTKYEDVHSTEFENSAMKTVKDLSQQLAKTYPLSKIKFQPELKILLSGSSLLKAMTVGGDLERNIPETVTEDYVLVYRLGGSYTFMKNGKRDLHGELLGDIRYTGSFIAELIDTKTKKVVVIVDLGKSFQMWQDIPESTYDDMLKNRSLGRFAPNKPYDEMIAASKKAMATFVADVKAAKPVEEKK